ncbi:MAG: COP23 domain-containing protein [Elainella sp. Prado103]|jgi:hypothetical protein|nr:COP23 domain-containing protein [Elainella sp. Prado103]
MKYKRLVFPFSVYVAGIAMVLASGSIAQAQSTGISYFCGVNRGKPTTMAKTPDGEKPIVMWSDLGDYSAQDRCEMVSNRFQKYMGQQSMSYITIGSRDGLPVVCAATSPEAGCQEQLFTLNSWEEADRIRQQLEQMSWYIQGPLLQGGQEFIYFNLTAYLSSEADPERDVFPLTDK